MRYPCLSFLELRRLSKLLNPAVAGAQIDRIFIPECAEHPNGFFKNEFVIEFRHSQLLVSLRTQACGVAFLSKKGLKPAKGAATRSGFDLALSKELQGYKVLSAHDVPGDRMLQLRITGPEIGRCLFLHFIPAIPEGVLVEMPEDGPWKVIASSKGREEFALAPPRELDRATLEKIPDRSELVSSLDHYAQFWMEARREEALGLRKQRLITHLTHQTQAVERKKKSIDQQTEQARQDPDWKYFGSLLQTHLHSKPVLKNKHYSLLDYEKGEEVLVPGDEKLNLKQQLEKFFHQAKRNKTRLEEGARRSGDLAKKHAEIEEILNQLKDFAGDYQSLLKIEQQCGMNTKVASPKDVKKLSGFTGKIYQSKEGFTILSGRSKEENLELTFKVAKGNDIWLHVKGRPGSHTVILLPPGKTASLETLLDAANLCLLHSGGKEWGKTEVDYTPRKYVKKIKNQTEVTYSGNKTLVVSVEPDRIKRLYGDES